MGKRSDQVPSIQPSTRLQSLRLQRSRSQGTLRVFFYFAPSCLGLKGRFHAGQLAGLLSGRLTRGCPRAGLLVSLYCLGKRVPGEKKEADTRACCHAKWQLAGWPCCCPLLHSVSQKRHTKMNKIRLKSSVHSLCAFVIAGKKVSRLNLPLLRDENKVEGGFFWGVKQSKIIFDEEEVESSDVLLLSAQNLLFACFVFFGWALVVWFASQECWDFLPSAWRPAQFWKRKVDAPEVTLVQRTKTLSCCYFVNFKKGKCNCSALKEAPSNLLFLNSRFPLQLHNPFCCEFILSEMNNLLNSYYDKIIQSYYWKSAIRPPPCFSLKITFVGVGCGSTAFIQCDRSTKKIPVWRQNGNNTNTRRHPAGISLNL